MWSLPDLEAINQRAVDEHEEIQAALKAEHDCEFCENKATIVLPYFHIFGDKPLGVIAACQECNDRGLIEESYFYCSGCDQYHVKNYTWELYNTQTEDGDELCLNCFRERALADDRNFIYPDDLEGMSDDELLHRIRKAKHLIAVGQKNVADLEEVSGVTLDSSTGHEVCGFSSTTDSTDSGTHKIREALREAYSRGHERAILVLDGGYQFAVSISVYVEAHGEERKAANDA